MTGSGLAWKTSCLLLARQRKEELNSFAINLVNLATIGTIADVEVLLGENRAIVKRAISLMRSNSYKRYGVKYLMEGNTSKITAGDVGFKIGPCINAYSRLKEKGAEIPFSLLIEKNQIYALKLANDIINVSTERKLLQAECYAEIKAQAEQCISNGDKVLVLFSKNVPSGIVGLLEGNLKEEFNRPAIVFFEKKLLGSSDCCFTSGSSLHGQHFSNS